MASSFKINWKAIGLSCFKPESLQLDTKSQVSKPSCTQRLSLSDISDPGSPSSAMDLSTSLIGSNLHIFTLMELKIITNGFSSSNFLGEGGFGPVYKGFIDDAIRTGLVAQPVAVKSLDLGGGQGHMEWLTEVIFLGQLKHPHLVKLIGYCCEDEHRLLVYEYMERGNLENQLFRRCSIPLPWLTRIKIALGAAKGLAFLHGEEKPVIYRDFKSSNILLDSEYTAKLSDFGFAKDGPEGDHTHVTTRVMGTHGYAAPEYVMTGHLTALSDVYSFGVVLLELITGKLALDKTRRNGEKNLVEWARPMLKDQRKLDRLIDLRLEGQYSFEGVKKAAALAFHCLKQNAKSRPTMRSVVKILESILDLKDIPVGPFVYVVSPQVTKRDGEPRTDKQGANVEAKETDGYKGEKVAGKKENGLYRHKNNNRKLRYRTGSSAVYSDTTL